MGELDSVLDFKERLDELAEDLQNFMIDADLNAEGDDEKALETEYLSFLRRIAEVVHEAQAAHSPDLHDLVAQADGLLNQGIRFGYGDHEDGSYGIYSESCIPSFAHQDDVAPLLQEQLKKGQATHMFIGGMIPEMGELLRFIGTDLKTVKSRYKLPPAWKTTLRPHPLSTSCARFLDPIPEWTATDRNSIATTIFEARCEVSSGAIRDPVDMKLSSSGNILALSSMRGWKNRTPYISYYLPNHEQPVLLEEFIDGHIIKADLASTMRDIMIDDERRLVFVADYDRVKSYRCNEPNVRGREKRVHTMNSEGYDGPLAMLANGGRMLRAGKRDIAFWNIDTLPTHGESGKDLIGTKIEEIETWRDDPEDIEPSSGSEPSGTIAIEHDSDDEGFKIGKWHAHPSNSNMMLCASERETGKYFCHAFDVDVGGKAVTRYLGHGGTVMGFSTVTADPNAFLTWCDDGHARLYDTRQALPVLTIGAEMQLMPAGSAVLAHPDGIPFIFAGASQSEAITLWDVRARKPVYELATGNNAVQSMVWDEKSSTLYAATTCDHERYRPAKIPIIKDEDAPSSGKEANAEGTQTAQGQGEVSVLEDDDDDDDDDDRMDEDDEDEDEDADERKSNTEYEPVSQDVCWPTRAYHAENYFGHVFDAGHHRLYKYSFKKEPNAEVLPWYGSATITSLSSSLGIW